MTTVIRSNHKGFGIHSPFAFNLVTKVLFPEKERGFWGSFMFPFRNQSIRMEEVLLRLLEFFKPGRVILVYNTRKAQESMPLGSLSPDAPSLLNRLDDDAAAGFPVFSRKLRSEALVRKIAEFSNAEKWIRLDDSNTPLPFEDNDFLIITGHPLPEVKLTHNAAEMVCFFSDLSTFESRQCFKKLGNDRNVSQTFEFNSCGIAIFNSKFQKENFVIKGKNSY